jgi:hypothetical protein
MENLGKSAITAIIIATGLLVVDLFLCMIALVCPSIGADTNYANTVVGILITALSLVIIAVVVAIIKIIRNIYK